MSLFALIVWVYDRPVQGNVIKLSQIERPRKAFEDYRQFEVVEAKLHGFGINTGVIGRVGDESNKKDLLAHLADTTKFQEVVKEVMARHKEKDWFLDTSVWPAGPAVDVEESTVTPPKKAKSKPKNSACLENRETKQRQAVLQKAAADLELTQLQMEIDDGFGTSSCSDNGLQDDSGCKGDDSSSTMLKQTFEVLNRTTLDQPVAKGFQDPQSSPQSSVFTGFAATPTTPTNRLEQDIACLRTELFQATARISQLEGNCQWLWGQVQQIQSSQGGNLPTEQRVPVAASSQPVNAASSQPVNAASSQPVNGQGNKTDRNQTSGESGSDETAEAVAGGFSVTQLTSMLVGDTFSKDSITLFRKLFKESDYLGRTIAGKKCSKTGETKQACDPQRMQVLYRVIQKKYSFVTPSMINKSLYDVVKPSRAGKKDN